uniref:Uncharacterized protein n=1 Tax=Rhizophora mucronata TaxID=61149 RepID=A0A2P2QAI4_RHIMU
MARLISKINRSSIGPLILSLLGDRATRTCRYSIGHCRHCSTAVAY